MPNGADHGDDEDDKDITSIIDDDDDDDDDDDGGDDDELDCEEDKLVMVSESRDDERMVWMRVISTIMT